MTKNELVEKLREMLAAAGHGEKTAMTHLFGVIFARHIGGGGVPAKQIADEYVRRQGKVVGTAIADGKNLARYVDVKDEVAKRWCPERSS